MSESTTGAYVYQQIVKSTEDWAADKTVLVENVWLFERKTDGKIICKLSDGRHCYADLPEFGLSAWDAAQLGGYTGTKEEFYAMLGSIDNKLNEANDLVQNLSGKYAETPTLEATPTEETLTYTSDGATRNFSIGQQCRVYEADQQDYVFYQLYDIADGKADWRVAGSGGASLFQERVTVSLASNQGAGDTAINGRKITVTYNEQSTEYVWNGTPIELTVPMATPYTVAAEALDGYATPDTQEITAEGGNEREVTLTYRCTLLTPTLDSNQTDKSDLDAATVSVSSTTVSQTVASGTAVKIPWGEQYTLTPSEVSGYATPAAVTGTADEAAKTETLTYNATLVTVFLTTNQSSASDVSAAEITLAYGTTSQTLSTGGSAKVPVGTDYTVSSSAVEGYKTPASQTHTAAGASANVTLTYQTELLTVNVTCDDSASVSGQQVTIAGTAHTLTSAGTVTVKIPYGTEYSVSVDAKSGYIAPDSQTYTAAQASRTVALEYEKITDAQITFDKSVSDPSNITGDINSGVIAMILAKFRRCLVKKTADGEVTIAYLRNDNSNYYEDGTAAKLDGTEGDVMVDFPEFYYKWEQVDTNKFRYRFSFYDMDGTFKHVPRSLVGAYKAYQTGSKLYSRSGVTPTTNVSSSNFDTYASARGTGYQRIDFQQHCVIAMMLYAKYGNRNLQAVLGAGGALYNSNNTTGSTNSIGNADTSKESSNYVNGLGLEGVFGCIYEWVKGVSINNRVWTITDPDGTTRKVNAGTSDGWITNVAMENGAYFDMVPTAAGGSETTYYSDYYYQSSSNSLVLARSNDSSSTYGGVAFAYAYYVASYAHTNYGSRLKFREREDTILRLSGRGRVPAPVPQEDEPCPLAKNEFGLYCVVGSTRSSKHMDF